MFSQNRTMKIYHDQPSDLSRNISILSCSMVTFFFLFGKDTSNVNQHRWSISSEKEIALPKPSNKHLEQLFPNSPLKQKSRTEADGRWARFWAIKKCEKFLDWAKCDKLDDALHSTAQPLPTNRLLQLPFTSLEQQNNGRGFIAIAHH